MKVIEIPEPKLSRFLFADTRIAWVWLVVRLYIAWQWLQAGWEKMQSPAWIGTKAGTAIKGFLQESLQKSSGQHPDVSSWYSWAITHLFLPHPVFLSYLVAYGELLIGIALLLGFFTGIAAFAGACMNFNYLFAGTVSINPLMALLQLSLILAWRNAGWIGLDRWLLPLLGTPWQKGKIFDHKPNRPTT